MSTLNIGDIVVRKSYGSDIYFTVENVIDRDSAKPVCVLRGMLYRIVADAYAEDLIKKDPKFIRSDIQREIMRVRSNIFRSNLIRRQLFMGRFRQRPGRILHIDSSESFLKMCRDLYRESGLQSVGVVADESEQPNVIRRALLQNNPDILVVTGHDGIKKGNGNLNSVDSYRNSKYYIQCVKEARSYEPDFNKLCIFAGACQSYFEGIMNAGANFASSPRRVNINALDPGIVSEKVALTDSRSFVTPQEVARLTISGSDGIGGIRTRGHLYSY